MVSAVALADGAIAVCVEPMRSLCVDASASPISRSATDDVVGLIENLESLPDASIIVETLFKGVE